MRMRWRRAVRTNGKFTNENKNGRPEGLGRPFYYVGSEVARRLRYLGCDTQKSSGRTGVYAGTEIPGKCRPFGADALLVLWSHPFRGGLRCIVPSGLKSLVALGTSFGHSFCILSWLGDSGSCV